MGGRVVANYLYNGILATDINTVWIDKEAYPFAAMCCSEDENGFIYLYLFSVPVTYNNSLMAAWHFEASEGKWLEYSAPKEKLWEKYGKEWDHGVEREFGGDYTCLTSYNPKWSNFDIYKQDGTLYLAASEPIPIPAPVIDPLSMWLGYQAGQWVARQRGKKQKTPVAYRYKLGLLTGTTTRKPPSAYAHTNTWVAKTWGGIADWSYDIVAGNVWSDGTNIYYSRNGTSEQIHYILDGDTWKEKSWNVTDFGGVNVWSDGINTYYSYDNTHYVLSGDTWEEKTWNGLTNFSGQQIWSDGEHTYHSVYSEHYILNGDTWEKLSWDINVSSNYNGSIGSFWSDGRNIYYSSWNTHYVLNGDTWEETTWNVNFWAAGIWTDGTNIYISGGGLSVPQYILKDGTWEEMAWESMPDGFTGCNTWSDGTNVYYSDGSDQYVLT